MLTRFLPRIRRELRLTVEGAREAILAVSERVNRRVHGLKLQWRIAALTEQIDEVHRRLGEQLAARPAAAGLLGGSREEIALALARASGQLAALRRHLGEIEGRVRELETDALRETFLRLQQDLGSRGLALERIVVPARSPAVGVTLREMPLPPACRALLLFRGPVVLDDPERTPLRPADVVILLGPAAELPQARTRLEPPLA